MSASKISVLQLITGPLGIMTVSQQKKKKKHCTAVHFRSFEVIFMNREGTGEDFGNVVALNVQTSLEAIVVLKQFS